MHKNSKLLLAAVAAGLVAAGTTAFTDSNTGMEDDIVGHSRSDTAGVTVINTANNLAADKSLLAEIVYTIQEDVSAAGEHEAWLVITTEGVEGTPIACTPTYLDDLDATTADGRLTCDTADIPVADVDSVSLTVTTL